ncbi:hypothetical protein EGT67_21620 [Prescottella agglutinans]|uniref:Uncharacterized protein n=1 Tax=Prescottella agglutinans TaxID=1644129 RepID=A0A3S3ASU7_9NOCA|nr:hypothetical protein [Prescottella agglutinans]RVW07563.1 hypothetical protein EGT67_21620 [Prescottella agglutinans]
MTRESVAPATPDVLDRLHRKLDRLLPGGTLPEPRSDGYRSGITSAKIFVLDERAQHSGIPIDTVSPKNPEQKTTRTRQ